MSQKEPNSWREAHPFEVEQYEAEQRRQQAIAQRMGQIMMQEYWQHLEEEKRMFWDWFNNERLNEED